MKFGEDLDTHSCFLATKACAETSVTGHIISSWCLATQGGGRRKIPAPAFGNILGEILARGRVFVKRGVNQASQPVSTLHASCGMNTRFSGHASLLLMGNLDVG